MANVLEILLRAKGGDQVKTEMGKANKATSQANELFKKLGTILTVGALVKGFSDSIKAFEQQELAVTKLNAALKTQNAFSEESSKAFQDQASSLQAVTTFGDEAILTAQALALNMGVQADTVQKITPLVLDFAAATGKDLPTAFRVAAQAAQGEVGILKSYGIIVDESQLKSDGFNAVLETMQSNFGGTAEAIAKSGVGPMKQFGNTIGDIKERIGATLIPALNDLIKSIEKWLPFLEKVALGVTAIFSTAIEGISTLADVIEKVISLKFKDIPKVMAEHGENIGQIWTKTTERMIDAEKSASEERTEIIKQEGEIRVEQSDAWLKKMEQAKQKELEAEEKRVEESSKKIIEEYNLRRQLGELNLKGVIESLESQIMNEDMTAEKRKAIWKSLSEFRQALGIETAAEVIRLQDEISGNLQSNLVDMLMAEKGFGEGVSDIWKSLERIVLNVILKQVLEERAAALLRIAAEKAIGAAKAISAHAGLPFIGVALGIAAASAIMSEIGKRARFGVGGQVPGSPGEPRLAVVHGGEKFIPRGREMEAERPIILNINISGMFIEADETKIDRLWRQVIKPAANRDLAKVGASLP